MTTCDAIEGPCAQESRSLIPVLTAIAIGAAAQFRRAIAPRLRMRAAERALHAMSDTMLKDIGISRGQIRSRVRGREDPCRSPTHSPLSPAHRPGKDFSMSTLTRDEIIERNRLIARRFLNGTHSRNIADVAIIDETVGPGIRCHGFPGITITDHESYKAFFRAFRQSFTDMDWTVHALVADEYFVAARWEIEATHSGDFAGVKGDGRRVGFDGMVLYRMQDGLIVETWLHINEMRLLSAIGAIPALAA